MKLSTQVCNQLFPDQLVERISHLGSGRMGSVYKVTLNNGEILCVKILTLGHSTRLQDCNGWKLAYKHLGFNFKTGEDNQYFYFTTPYFEGQLFHYATDYNLKLRFEIIQSLIKAINDIHRKGLIHRDLTCNNIILDKEEKNQVHIIDFGRSVDAFNLYNSSDTDYIDKLQLPGQSTTTSNIRRIFQPYTAPEHFRKHYNNNSTIGFRSDYYSIAQLFRFLIPEYSYLANEIIHTEGIDRSAAFAEFSDQIDDILKKNENNPKFNESNNSYCKELRSVYKRIIFFIREILHRLFRLTFQSPGSSPKKNSCNKHQTSVFFKSDKANSLDTSLPRNACIGNRPSISNS
jgi:serine/threonine protein kinase